MSGGGINKRYDAEPERNQSAAGGGWAPAYSPSMGAGRGTGSPFDQEIGGLISPNPGRRGGRRRRNRAFGGPIQSFVNRARRLAGGRGGRGRRGRGRRRQWNSPYALEREQNALAAVARQSAGMGAGMRAGRGARKVREFNPFDVETRTTNMPYANHPYANPNEGPIVQPGATLRARQGVYHRPEPLQNEPQGIPYGSLEEEFRAHQNIPGGSVVPGSIADLWLKQNG